MEAGAFGDLGVGMSKAIVDALDEFDLRGDVTLLGPSLGSSVAAGAITPLFEEGVDIESVIGIDPVGWTGRQPVLVRGEQFLDSCTFAEPYLAANHPEH